MGYGPVNLPRYGERGVTDPTAQEIHPGVDPSIHDERMFERAPWLAELNEAQIAAATHARAAVSSRGQAAARRRRWRAGCAWLIDQGVAPDGSSCCPSRAGPHASSPAAPRA